LRPDAFPAISIFSRDEVAQSAILIPQLAASRAVCVTTTESKSESFSLSAG